MENINVVDIREELSYERKKNLVDFLKTVESFKSDVKEFLYKKEIRLSNPNGKAITNEYNISEKEIENIYNIINLEFEKHPQRCVMVLTVIGFESYIYKLINIYNESKLYEIYVKMDSSNITLYILNLDHFYKYNTEILPIINNGKMIARIKSRWNDVYESLITNNSEMRDTLRSNISKLIEKAHDLLGSVDDLVANINTNLSDDISGDFIKAACIDIDINKLRLDLDIPESVSKYDKTIGEFVRTEINTNIDTKVDGVEMTYKFDANIAIDYLKYLLCIDGINFTDEISYVETINKGKDVTSIIRLHIKGD